MKILVNNVGSTSLKFRLFNMPEEQLLCEAKIDRIGSEKDAVYQYHNKLKNTSVVESNICIQSYMEGIRKFISDMNDNKKGVIVNINEISGIGFKTVLAKGFYGVHPYNDDVRRAMEDVSIISPTHTQPYINAISHFRSILPDTPIVCSFETGFHKTIPMYRRIYPIPYEWTQKHGIMRLGYHGASHSYIAYEMSRRMGGTKKLISCHLGGSSSMCAINDGISVDNSFGFSLQTGLPHGKRTGDIDSYIIPYLLNQGIPRTEILYKLNNHSGLAGVSGMGDDAREIEEAAVNGNDRARLAVDMFVNSIVKYLGAFYMELGGLNHLVFTGGIGENSAYIRKRVISDIEHLGIILNDEKNSNLKGEGCVSEEGSQVDVWVLPTNEEIMVARETYQCITKNENNG